MYTLLGIALLWCFTWWVRAGPWNAIPASRVFAKFWYTPWFVLFFLTTAITIAQIGFAPSFLNFLLYGTIAWALIIIFLLLKQRKDPEFNILDTPFDKYSMGLPLFLATFALMFAMFHVDSIVFG